ncbi:MAG: hypothetical protein ABI585_12820 [Betaproteobacteria bacterium]
MITRGFYIEAYPGTSLRTVTLGHEASDTGERTITLTARANAYNGTFLGLASVTRTLTPTSHTGVGHHPATRRTRRAQKPVAAIRRRHPSGE